MTMICFRNYNMQKKIKKRRCKQIFNCKRQNKTSNKAINEIARKSTKFDGFGLRYNFKSEENEVDFVEQNKLESNFNFDSSKK